MVERRWRVLLGAAAELDFANIVKWTAENSGARQSRIYRDTLVQAIRELAEGPDVVGSKAREASALESDHAGARRHLKAPKIGASLRAPALAPHPFARSVSKAP